MFNHDVISALVTCQEPLACVSLVCFFQFWFFVCLIWCPIRWTSIHYV